LTSAPLRRYSDFVKRLELARVRVCSRCGKGGAELRAEDGELLVVPLDASRARQLRDEARGETRWLTDLVVEQLGAAGREVVLDVAGGRLQALLSVVQGNETEVVECTADEGVALAVRAGLRIYATDEALADAASRSSRPARPGGTGGPDTLH
jgi:hypothetical protein